MLALNSIQVKASDHLLAYPIYQGAGTGRGEAVDFFDVNRLAKDLDIRRVQIIKIHDWRVSSIPPYVMNFDFIRIIDLAGTRIQCEDLKYLSPRIKELNLEGCGDVQGLPESLKTLKNLEKINLSKTWIKNEDLLRLPKSVRQLEINNCEDITHFPQEFGEYARLRILSCRATSITYLGELPIYIEVLDARGCPISFITGFNWERIREIYLDHPDLDIEQLPNTCCNIHPNAIKLELITINRKAAENYFRWHGGEEYTDSKVVSMIKKGNYNLKYTDILILDPAS
jgi:Leucine-rich repeat (LRR) protein